MIANKMLPKFMIAQSQILLSIVFSLAVLALITFNACESKKPVTQEEKAVEQKKQIDSIDREDCLKAEKDADNYAEIKYQKIELTQKILNGIFKSSKDSIDGENFRHVITTLNRKELRFFRKGDTIIYPDTITQNIVDYSTFPRYYCDARNLPKLIVVSNVSQSYACYEHGKQVRFSACNTGKETTPTYPGRYSVVWKSLLRHSSIDSNWVLPYTVNFHQWAGNAFHQFDMPGRAVSHSCVRQLMEDAKWLFKWAKGAKLDSNKRFIPNAGTPVLMLGMFDYSRKRGGMWLELKSNKDGITKLQGDPMQVEEALIPIVQIPKESRGALPNRKRYLYAEDSLRAKGIIRQSVVLHESVNFNEQRRKKKKEEERKKKKEEQKKQTKE